MTSEAYDSDVRINRPTDLFILHVQYVQPEKRNRNSDSINAGYSGVRIPANGNRFSDLQNAQTGSVAHPASYSMRNIFISPE